MIENEGAEPVWDWESPKPETAAIPPSAPQADLTASEIAALPPIDRAKHLRSKGATWDQIAKQCGGKPASWSKKASRDNWPAAPIAVTAAPSAALHIESKLSRSTKDSEQSGAQHVALISRITPKLAAEIERRIVDRPTTIPTREVLQLAQALEVTDKVGRRTHGLDDGNGRTQVGLSSHIHYHLESKQTASDPTIEV